MSVNTALGERAMAAFHREKAIEQTQRRLVYVMLMFAGATFVIFARLTQLATTQDSSHGSYSIKQGSRGGITDRNGSPIARTIRVWDIAIQPQRIISEKSTLASALSRALPEHSADQYLRMLESQKRFIYLKHRASSTDVQIVNSIGEPAIMLLPVPQRLYPQAKLAAHVLGWTDADGHGVTGMEKVLDRRLWSSSDSFALPLSIDIRVQSAVELELSAAATKFTALNGCSLVLDVRSGEVIAMASYPSFNPNLPSVAKPPMLRNNCTQSVYELGSTFKAVMIANAIETGVVSSMSKRYDATAPLKIGRFTIHDDEPDGRWLNVPEMMVRSSNIVTARISEEIGEQREKEMFAKVGFSAPPEVELTAKAKPIWPTYWGRSTVMTVGYGHGIAVTPLNLAIAYSALVNGGLYRPATLIKRGPDNPLPEGRRVISETTSAYVRQLLRLVVMPSAGGTGRKADVPGYRLGGKTGTAAKAVGGGYAKKVNVSTFVGVFPMDAPRYVVLLTLDSPHGTADTFGLSTAAWTSAPAVSRIVSRIGFTLGVVPDMRLDIDESQMLPLVASALPSMNSGARNVE